MKNMLFYPTVWNSHFRVLKIQNNNPLLIQLCCSNQICCLNVWVCRPDSHFPHPFPDLASKIHTSFQAWPLRNKYYIIITQLRMPSERVFKIYFSFMSFFLSHSCTSVAPLKPNLIPDQKWSKCIPIFRQKWCLPKLGATYLQFIADIHEREYSNPLRSYNAYKFSTGTQARRGQGKWDKTTLNQVLRIHLPVELFLLRL